jgi:hypothetical protein
MPAGSDANGRVEAPILVAVSEQPAVVKRACVQTPLGIARIFQGKGKRALHAEGARTSRIVDAVGLFQSVSSIGCIVGLDRAPDGRT